MKHRLILFLIPFLFLVSSASAFEASFAGGPVLQVGSDGDLLEDSGFKFLAILNFPLKTDVWEMTPLFDVTSIKGRTGSGVNSVTGVGIDIGLELHPWRGFIITPVIGAFAGPTFLSLDTSTGSTSTFAANTGVYMGGAFRTGSLTFYIKGLYDYMYSFGTTTPKSFSTLSAVAGVEIFIDILFGI